MSDAARLRITLLDLDPAPWREIEVPLSMTFKGLHDAIQAAFLWYDAHLWEVEIAGRRYGPAAADLGGVRIYSASSARLSRLRDATEALYSYDMGDDWRHRIEVRDLFTADPGIELPRFLRGRWRAPPEDVGGPPGFEMFLDAVADPAHPDHAEMLSWYGGPFEIENIEAEVVAIQLRRLARARRKRR